MKPKYLDYVFTEGTYSWQIYSSYLFLSSWVFSDPANIERIPWERYMRSVMDDWHKYFARILLGSSEDSTLLAHSYIKEN